MQVGIAATALAGLALTSMLFYGVGCALTTRNAYGLMSLRREIQDLKAQNALLGYQINLTESNQRLQLAAARLELRPAEVAEVDYVVLPHSGPAGAQQLAANRDDEDRRGLTAGLRELAMEVSSGARGRAEASTIQSHRR